MVPTGLLVGPVAGRRSQISPLAICPRDEFGRLLRPSEIRIVEKSAFVVDKFHVIPRVALLRLNGEDRFPLSVAEFGEAFGSVVGDHQTAGHRHLAAVTE